MLTIELVPSTVWYSNLRSELPKSQWDILRKRCYANAKWLCEVCGGKGLRWPVECHEVWEFDDERKIQILRDIISLCPRCHEVKHIGLAVKLGHDARARKHLASVNGWSDEQTRTYIATSFRVWRERSRHKWELDISWVESHL